MKQKKLTKTFMIGLLRPKIEKQQLWSPWFIRKYFSVERDLNKTDSFEHCEMCVSRPFCQYFLSAMVIKNDNYSILDGEIVHI